MGMLALTTVYHYAMSSAITEWEAHLVHPCLDEGFHS